MIDYVGRRLLLLTTLPLMAIFQLVTGLTFRDHTKVVTFAYLFCVAYSIGEGPVPLVSSRISQAPVSSIESRRF
jgi:hypothetical protein